MGAAEAPGRPPDKIWIARVADIADVVNVMMGQLHTRQSQLRDHTAQVFVGFFQRTIESQWGTRGLDETTVHEPLTLDASLTSL